MNISRFEQRVLHELAKGGRIDVVRLSNGKVAAVTCFTREGFGLADCTLAVFNRLLRRGLIHSAGGRPYAISREGRLAVRGQLDNR
ncbi:YjhX family toxin [Sandaracinobacteroides saxicola]|uniref:UPF0386 protein H3309_05180 n=1 Tax=Sandaracinobacteroides saxicola TaxID=2759707 RepID=A0A7G5IKH5_9SPHN|nr:YjhX family toxin [Sandaracinobacteroides saxicola]QMW23867.1 YjhX family toxin [Sandaracinobacteroides saxicola]